MWFRAVVSYLKQVDWIKTAFERLVVEDDTKQLLKGPVEVHKENKNQGRIIHDVIPTKVQVDPLCTDQHDEFDINLPGSCYPPSRSARGGENSRSRFIFLVCYLFLMETNRYYREPCRIYRKSFVFDQRWRADNGTYGCE